MKPFEPEQVDDIVRYVESVEKDVLLQEDKDDGHALTIPEGLDTEEKVQIIKRFCAGASARICVYAPPPEAPVLEHADPSRL
jgi:hypothetical protein